MQLVDAQSGIVNRQTSDVDVMTMFRAYHDTRDISLRDQLICRHLHLVHGIARRFSGLGESLDDLIQEGSIGLLNAVDLFDPARGVKFSTYASHHVTSQIQHYLRDRGRLIRQPAWVQELNSKVTRATEQLTQELGRDPLPDEVALKLNLNVDSINHVLAARELNHVISLNAPIDGSGDSDLALIDKEKIHATKLATLQLSIEDRIVLEEAITNLKTLEEKVVRLYFFGDLNQSEIARKLGISVNYSSYLLRRAVSKIKAVLDEQRLQAQEPAPTPRPTPPPLPDDASPHERIPGIYTDHYFRLRVEEEIVRSQRYPTNFSLMLVGITFQEAGIADPQQFLLAISTLLRNNIRTVDLIAYMGDNRFALLLPHTGREAKVLGERLCYHAQHSPSLAPYSRAAFYLNVGFTVFPIDGTTAENLFKQADAALALATTTGPYSAAPAPRYAMRSMTRDTDLPR